MRWRRYRCCSVVEEASLLVRLFFLPSPSRALLIFSSLLLGGPGKGMYSKLYTSVLNQHHSVDYCASFHHVYLDSGLFGINIAVHHSFLGRTPDLIAAQLDAVTRPMQGGIGEPELRRARNQLKSSLAMALESRMVQVEDLGVRFSVPLTSTVSKLTY